MTWPKVKLGEVCEVVSGSTPKTGNAEYWNGDILWATPKDLSKLDSIYLESTEKQISQAGMKSCSTRLLPVGSVLFSSRAPIGHVAINKIPVCTNQGFKSLIPHGHLVHNKFLYFWLRANRDYLDGLGNGATFREVSKTTVERVEIPLPPLEEQKRLAAILDQADALRRARRESLARLDELAQSLFLELFGDPATNPKGWDVVNLEELMDIRRGASPRPIDRFLNGTVNWIKIGDGTKGSDIYLESCAEKVTEEGAKKSVMLKEGSMIFANCGVSLGFARILRIDGCIHDGWLAFENISPKLDKIYLLKALNAMTLNFRAMAPEGTQPNLNTGIMKKFGLILPPLALQQQFAEQIEELEAIKSRARASLTELDALFASLQARAFSGELSK